MHWNYRIVKFDIDTEIKSINKYWHEVCEVYYDDNRVPINWAESHNLLAAENIEDIKDEYKAVAEAFEKPVLAIINDKLIEV